MSKLLLAFTSYAYLFYLSLSLSKQKKGAYEAIISPQSQGGFKLQIKT